MELEASPLPALLRQGMKLKWGSWSLGMVCERTWGKPIWAMRSYPGLGTRWLNRILLQFQTYAKESPQELCH